LDQTCAKVRAANTGKSEAEIDQACQKALLDGGFHLPFVSRFEKPIGPQDELDLNQLYAIGAWLFGARSKREAKPVQYTDKTGAKRELILPSSEKWNQVWEEATGFTKEMTYGARDRMFKWAIYMLKGSKEKLNGKPIPKGQYLNPHDYYNRLLGKGVTINARNFVNDLLDQKLNPEKKQGLEAVEKLEELQKKADAGQITPEEKKQQEDAIIKGLADQTEKPIAEAFHKGTLAGQLADEFFYRWAGKQGWTEKDKPKYHHIIENIIFGMITDTRNKKAARGIVDRNEDQILEEALELEGEG